MLMTSCCSSDVAIGKRRYRFTWESGYGGLPTALIPVCGRQRQVDLCEFKSSLVYEASSRTVSYTEKHCLKETKEGKNSTYDLQYRAKSMPEMVIVFTKEAMFRLLICKTALKTFLLLL